MSWRSSTARRWAGLVAAETSAELVTFTMVQVSMYAAMQIPVGVALDRRREPP
jgi:hypothetical protein